MNDGARNVIPEFLWSMMSEVKSSQMKRCVFVVTACIGLKPNLVAQTLPRISNPERFHWNREVTGLQTTAVVLSEKPSFISVYPGNGLTGPDGKPLILKLVRPDTAATGNVTESSPSFGGVAVVLRNASSHPVHLAWTGGESRCQVWDATGKELAPYFQGTSALPAPPILLSLPPGSFLSEYHAFSSAYGMRLLLRPLQPGTYSIRCRWDAVLDEGYDPQLHRHRFNQDLQISAPELTLHVLPGAKR